MMNQDVNVFEDFDFSQPESTTKKIFDGLIEAGADVITTGNHVWDEREA